MAASHQQRLRGPVPPRRCAPRWSAGVGGLSERRAFRGNPGRWFAAVGRDSHAKHQPKQEKVFGPTLLAGLAAWGLITIAVSAHAQPALGGDLQWTAPPGCPDRSAVLHRIEQWLGHRLALEADASMVGHIERRGSAISLELRIEQGETAATRRLSGGTCEMLTDAVALMIAMAVDPDAVAARRRLGELALPAEGASPTDEVVESGAANGSRVPDAPPGVDGSATATEDSRAALEGEGEGEKEGGREKEGEGEDETEEEAGEEAGAPSRARSASTRELPRSPPALEAVSYSNDTLGAEGDTRGLRFVGSVGFAATFGALPHRGSRRSSHGGRRHTVVRGQRQPTGLPATHGDPR